MSIINVNLNNKIRKMKIMHAVNNGPAVAENLKETALFTLRAKLCTQKL